MRRRMHNKGFSIVEVLVAAFVFSAILGSLIFVSDRYLSGAEDSLSSAQGAYLAEEGIEAAKSMRDAAWSNISSLQTGSAYWLWFDVSSSTDYRWRATTTAQTTGIFSRTITFAPVERDTEGHIVASGGTVDPNSREVTASVFWPSQSGTTTKSISTYITDVIGS